MARSGPRGIIDRERELVPLESACGRRPYRDFGHSSGVFAADRPSSLSFNCKKGVSMQRQSGFTLIELMVTVAIIAILAGIAVPSYTSYIVRGKLTEAHSNLLAMRTKMELYFQDNRSYVGACAPGTVAPLAPGTPPGTLKYFTISCPPANLTATTYLVQADGFAGTDLEGLTMTI